MKPTLPLFHTLTLLILVLIAFSATAGTEAKFSFSEKELLHSFSGVPVRAAAGDLNGDGIMDVVASQISDEDSFNRVEDRGCKLLLFVGTANGEFDSPVTQSTGFCAIGVGIADVNSDDYDDLLLSYYRSLDPKHQADGEGAIHLVNVFHGPIASLDLNRPSVGYGIDAAPEEFFVEDFSGDGVVDILHTGSDFQIGLRGKDDGGYDHIATLSEDQPNNSITFVDITNDGTPDRFLVRMREQNDSHVYFDLQPGFRDDGGYRIKVNNDDRKFIALLNLLMLTRVGSYLIHAVGFGDFNGDGSLDLALLKDDVGAVVILPLAPIREYATILPQDFTLSNTTYVSQHGLRFSFHLPNLADFVSELQVTKVSFDDSRGFFKNLARRLADIARFQDTFGSYMPPVAKDLNGDGSDDLIVVDRERRELKLIYADPDS